MDSCKLSVASGIFGAVAGPALGALGGNLAKKLGFGGKACIHPDQVQISNKIF